MPEPSWMLARAGERFEMPEPAFDRLLRRRERRERTRRATAAVVALLVSVGGVGTAIVGLRRGGAAPASGGPTTGPSPAGSGWVGTLVPSVGIWASIAALTLVLFAIVRLRERRPASSTPSPNGRGSLPSTRDGDPARSAAPIAARRPGRREETMGTHVAPFPERHSARNVWVTVGVLALLALAIGTGVLIGRATVEDTAKEPAREPAAIEGLASAEMTARVDAVLAASSGDADEIASVYAEDATFVYALASDPESYGEPQVRAGLDNVIEAMLGANAYGDFSVERIGPVLGQGDDVAVHVAFHGAGGWEGTYGVSLFRFGEDSEVLQHFSLGE